MALGMPNGIADQPVLRRSVPRGLARAGSVRLLWFGLALAALALAAAASLAIGSRALPLATVWDALTGGAVTGQERAIVLELRGPRTIIGILAGAAFGLSGALLQG